ncbi:MAG: pteridine-dependent deoxygenase [Rhodanobacteraceae bacterium]
MSQLIAPAVIAESVASLPPLRIGYSRVDATSLVNEPDVLAVIGFGTHDGKAIKDDPRRLRVGLELLGDPVHEVWRGKAPVQSGVSGEVRWSSDGDYRFVAVEVDENDHDGISGAAEHAYGALTAHLHASATPHVLRLWNYFDAINAGDGDDERYRRFCVGRARGMEGTWHETYPAATAIGRRDGVRSLQVYALAARLPGVAVENPRQVNAWCYPRQYGPTPPTFARGMVTPAAQLLISGTAAVVGAASQHEDDMSAQLDETLANLASLIAAARIGEGSELGAGSLLKAYVRDRAHAELLRTRLRTRAPGLEGLLLLEGEICRRELLTEIDGVHG